MSMLFLNKVQHLFFNLLKENELFDDVLKTDKDRSFYAILVPKICLVLPYEI